MKYDFLIVGAGLFGATCAEQLKAKGYRVLVIDRRSHIAGNAYTKNVDGINVHIYGPHIFHTNNKKVWDYVQRFADFNNFTNSPIANYCGELYSLPFNMNTFNKMWGVVSPDEAKMIINEQRTAFVTDAPRNLEEQALSLVGKDIYEKLIKGYTQKQWGRECIDLPAFIIKRLPLRFTYDNNYFDDLYQGIPVGGYTDMVCNMLDGVEIRLNTDYLKNKKEYDDIADRIIYTGPIDEYYNYCFGALEYRTLKFDHEKLNIKDYQGNAVVNYTDAKTPWTRITEHKWFEFGKESQGNDIPYTIISKEYSTEWKSGDEPYYPINDGKNNSLYQQYHQLADTEKRVVFGGRLGEYKYYDMDKVIERAFSVVSFMP